MRSNSMGSLCLRMGSSSPSTGRTMRTMAAISSPTPAMAIRAATVRGMPRAVSASTPGLRMYPMIPAATKGVRIGPSRTSMTASKMPTASHSRVCLCSGVVTMGMSRGAGEGDLVKCRSLRHSGTVAAAPFYRFLCLISHSFIIRDHVHKAPGFPLLS